MNGEDSILLYGFMLQNMKKFGGMPDEKLT